jgi:hypothetical protein
MAQCREGRCCGLCLSLSHRRSKDQNAMQLQKKSNAQ